MTESESNTVLTHTPGPWRSQGWVPTWAYIPIHDARHNLIASMYPDSGHKYTREQVEANARLVAAAPELLECVKLIRQIVVDAAPDGFNPLVGDWAERLYASQSRTHKALLQAEGRTASKTPNPLSPA